jgi:hypothetical protein
VTDQIRDSIAFRGRDYEIAGICGVGLFAPEKHGLHPVEMSTACWRGYWCEYRISNANHLLLEKLVIALDGEERQEALSGEGPLLFGRRPEKRSYDFAYQTSGVSIPYFGGMVIGTEEANSPLVDWFSLEFYGYDFRHVWELVFEDGRLVAAFDRSKTLEELRQTLTANTKRRKKDMDERRKWLEEQFYLQSYDWPLYHT